MIWDIVYKEGREVELKKRNVMRNVIEEYRKRGMKKVVEKEIEFYMVRKKKDKEYKMKKNVGS